MKTGATVVIAASTEDALAESVAAELRGRDVNVLFLDAARPAIEVELVLDLTPLRACGWIGLVDGDRVPISSISGVLWRAPDPFVLPADLHPEDRAFARSETTAAWDGMLTVVRCPVLNRPTAAGPFWCTPAPARALAEAALGAPDVEVSRGPRHGDVRAEGRWLLGAARASARPRIVTDGELEIALADDADELTYLVAIPNGRLLDLMVICGVVLAVEHADAGAHRLAPTPTEAVAPALALASHLGLDFAVIRVVETARGAFTCIDVDTAPTLDGLDSDARRAVVQRVADALGSGAQS